MMSPYDLVDSDTFSQDIMQIFERHTSGLLPGLISNIESLRDEIKEAIESIMRKEFSSFRIGDSVYVIDMRSIWKEDPCEYCQMSGKTVHAGKQTTPCYYCHGKGYIRYEAGKEWAVTDQPTITKIEIIQGRDIVSKEINFYTTLTCTDTRAGIAVGTKEQDLLLGTEKEIFYDRDEAEAECVRRNKT